MGLRAVSKFNDEKMTRFTEMKEMVDRFTFQSEYLIFAFKIAISEVLEPVSKQFAKI